MRQTFNDSEEVWWFELEGPVAPCTARANITLDGNTITIFDFWTHAPLQGKGYAKELLKQIRKKFQRVVVESVESGAFPFWNHMLKTGLVDEVHR